MIAAGRAAAFLDFGELRLGGREIANLKQRLAKLFAHRRVVRIVENSLLVIADAQIHAAFSAM